MSYRDITFQKVLQTETVKLASELGERARTPDGRAWIYVEANEAVTIHKALTRTANSDQDTVSSASDGSSNRIFITQSGASFTVGQFAGAYGLVDSGTGVGQFFKIKDNTGDTLELFVDYALGTALSDVDSDIVIVTPYLVELTAITTLNQIPVGVAQVAYSDNDFAWALERGPGAVTAGANLVANELTTPGDNTEGTVITVANGETLDDVSSFGRCLVANDTADQEGMIDVHVW